MVKHKQSVLNNYTYAMEVIKTLIESGCRLNIAKDVLEVFVVEADVEMDYHAESSELLDLKDSIHNNCGRLYGL